MLKSFAGIEFTFATVMKVVDRKERQEKTKK
jgi:hypothetical protein